MNAILQVFQYISSAVSNWQQIQGRFACREQPGNAKAMYRKAVAHSMLGSYEEAEEEYKNAKEADPSTAGEIDREISKMRQRQKAARLKEKQDLTSFFDRGRAS